jgi:hypothetical protein
MARPSVRKNTEDLKVLQIPHGIIEELRFKPSEDERERDHRLRKDFLSFLVKDLLASFIAFLIVIGATIYSLWALMHPSLSKEERQWAMSMLASLGTAVVGFVFGKATK